MSQQHHTTQRSLLQRTILEEGTSLEQLQATSFKHIRDAIGDSQIVLIGEASHGSEEFYRIRAELTKVLVAEDGFDAVLCEGDFPPFYELNRYVGGAPPRCRTQLCKIIPPSRSCEDDSDDGDAALTRAFEGFQRFPRWMWVNNATQDFVTWLRAFNLSKKCVSCSNRFPVQLLGLDIYSLFRSADEVLDYLVEAGEKDLAKLARRRYSTLNSFRPQPSDYTVALYHEIVPSQAMNVARMLASLCEQERRLCQLPGDGHELFNAIENARVVAAAEAYYRQSFLGGDVTWNLRDSAFLDTIKETIEFVEHRKRERGDLRRARVVVWAHNSHVGDAMATEHCKRGQYNVGQLCRQAFKKENVYIVGFSTHDGTVRAARKWGGRHHIMQLNPSLEGSHERLFHSIARQRSQNAFGYTLRSNAIQGLPTLVDTAARELFDCERPERFVGVNYIKATEFQSHYSICRLSEQYDFILHVDRSTALQIDHTSDDEALELQFRQNQCVTMNTAECAK